MGLFRRRRHRPHHGSGAGPRDWTVGEPWEEERGNSPWAFLGVFGIIMAIVLAVAVVGPRLFGGDGGTSTEAQRYSAGAAPTGAPAPRIGTTAEPANNELLAPGVSLASVNCELPELGRSREDLRRYYEAMIACLDEAWRPALFDSGFGWASPELSLDTGPSRCGAPPDPDEAAAFYCSGTIFMPRDWILEDIEYFARSAPWHLLVLAHEYGHHVQWQSRILQAANVRSGRLPENGPERLEITRRSELQAECFAGLFIGHAVGRGSVRPSVVRALRDMRRKSEGSETHGTPEHRKEWFERGLEGDGPAACNTWAAPAEAVG